VNPENLTVFGYVLRPHGLKGSLKVKLIGGGIPQIEKDEPVFIPLQGGPVPFFAEEPVDTVRDTVVIKLEGIDTVEAAERFVGKEVLIEPERLQVEEPTGLDVLVGYTVVDVNLGHLGTVSGIMELPMQSILEIDQNGKQILVPAVEDILLSIDTDTKTITLDTPPGLVDIYLNG
jgi:16S rRNA processing protein RimM